MGSPRRSPGASLASAILKRSRRGWPPTGRASKKSPAAARPHRPDRRERPADGPAGPPNLGAARTDPGLRPERRPWPPREGLGRGRPVALAAPGSAGALLQDLGQRVLRQLVRDRLPAGDAPRPGGAVRG